MDLYLDTYVVIATYIMIGFVTLMFTFAMGLWVYAMYGLFKIGLNQDQYNSRKNENIFQK